MVKYWIFKVIEHKAGKDRLEGIDVYKQRMRQAFWGLKERRRDGRKVANITKLERGDYVVFYLAGSEDEQSFLGTAILDSSFYKLGQQEKEKLTRLPFFVATHGVKFMEIDAWDTPVSIRPLIENLQFITNKRNWGSHIQGSITPIPEEDFNIIISQRGIEEITKLSSTKEPSLTEESSETIVKRKIRDAGFREGIRELYEYSCAVCGKKRFDRSKHPEAESAHIYPKEKNGKDDWRNGISLCRLHHWAFEKGLFSIRDDYSIIIEDRIRNDDNYKEINSYEGKKIKLPNEKSSAPHPVFLREHRRIHGLK